MTQHVAHRKSDEKTEYDCCECGGHVSGCVPSPTHPYCALCVWLPGWWHDPALRDRLTAACPSA
ncbi:MAG TPA: hypothetical protein VGR63_13435, partial [Casimicrobiaceae bacterium]|nr:hypothetical protein [Casimicrobiaceae bacterium]